jgi:glycine dehydrogenase
MTVQIAAASIPLVDLERADSFTTRHIGPSRADQATMLARVGRSSLEELINDAVPASIRTVDALTLSHGRTEPEVLAELRHFAARNTLMVQMIGLGYSDTVTPPVILRKVLENPAWYTAYTPYQAEISQGRLEALLNFQTMVCDLTGLDVASASLLDEGTAAAEAMTLLRRSAPATGSGAAGSARSSEVFLVDRDTHPQTLAVLATRAEPLGIQLQAFDPAEPLPSNDFYGVLLSYPGGSGRVRDLTDVIEQAHQRGAGVVVATDLLALTLLKPPGEMGADVTIGSSQRFGVPLGFGGPHAGFMSVRSGLERNLPGRLVGVSIDAAGHPAYRLALQTREQHIRREKATSNICTAQVLLAVIASMYAVYHGPAGLAAIARRAHRFAVLIAAGLQEAGHTIVHAEFFDTIHVRVADAAAVVASACDHGVNLRMVDSTTVGISTDETTNRDHVRRVWAAFGTTGDGEQAAVEDLDAWDGRTPDALPQALARTSDYLTHPVFHEHRTETEMLRYLRLLSGRDYALDRGMIPLGSCTMKLNATTEMQPITWPEFAGLHPFAPVDQARGTLELIGQLTDWLAELTGYDAVSLQPNAGSQGEFAGLLAIRAHHRASGQPERTVCLIPSSAHGTNAASAVMAGMRVVVVACDEHGNVDVGDLKAKIDLHANELAALMVTYPSTHGVFEESITELCALVHDAGGQVYVDGANLNALVGLAQPGRFGADVSHLNLHKTFCIPHGGGGPGVGPVAVRAHLAPYLPNHPLTPEAGPATGVGPVSSAPWGSAGILPISWAYIRLMGGAGLAEATEVAILSANYISARLSGSYPVLYTGRGGLVAHECIVDLRGLTRESGVTVDDVAKRLIDYGFHAPTMSFPVAGTLMIEPTESEDLAELDRFCDAMIAIRAEIDRVARGEWPADNNPLHNAPHTAQMLLGAWEHPYTREEAAYPVATLRTSKYWAPVRRIDGAYGDRHLMCQCGSPEDYAS